MDNQRADHVPKRPDTSSKNRESAVSIEPSTPNEHAQSDRAGDWSWKSQPLLLRRSVWIAGTGIVLFFAFLLYLRLAPLPDGGVPQASVILGASGNTIADLYPAGKNRIKVPLASLPKYVPNATLAIEDHNFYQHGGINLYGITRAFVADLRAGSVVEGGSTITQQLAKNLFLTEDRTLIRKIRDALLALQLEMKYTKDEILDQYLNVIYYGHGAYGIQNAAETYFGIPADKLDLAQAALLAGIPKGPTYFNPLDHYDSSKSRQKIVLDVMAKYGYITKEQAQVAYQEPLSILRKAKQSNSDPYFVDYVTRLAGSKFHVSESDLYRGGLQIHTTLDPKLQQYAEEAVRSHIPEGSDLETALVALDPKTGDIKAFVGGKNWSQSQFDRVVATRQPGSSFKPVLYLEALHDGFTPATRILSEPTTFAYDNNAKQYEVHNYGNIYENRYIDMREAIAKSDNVYAVTTNMEVGPEKVVEMARKLGITESLQPYPSVALGVFPVSPLEMARAYAVLANGGFLVEPRAITEISDIEGRVVTLHQPQKQRVVDAQSTYVLTNLLEGVFAPGGTAARIRGDVQMPVAGKTGTTDTDSWMVGYTPNLVVAVWVGYDKNTLLSDVDSHVAAPIWGDFMHKAQQVSPKASFAVPDGVVKMVIDPTTGMIATPKCPQRETDYFIAGTEPNVYCTVHPDEATNPGRESPLRSFWQWFKHLGGS